MSWNSYKSGKRWRVLGTGEVETEEGIPRTGGEPLSMWHLWLDYGAALRRASERFDIPIAWIMGMLAIEAQRLPEDRSHFDPRSVREEPGFLSDRKTPDEISSGLMQTLLSTADQMNRKERLYLEPNGDVETMTRADLWSAERSIMLGTAYMRDRADKYGLDPVLLSGAYNAGSLRFDADSPFHILAYSPTRTTRMIEWINDAVEVLRRFNEVA